ncbi:ATP-dependent DNA ligase, partial [Pseudomonas sp. 4B]|nr:ATP-dependent DNA ligase [Pseudomonas sp. 4B]
LEDEGVDIRAKPLMERRARFETIVQDLGINQISVSQVLPFSTWEEAAKLREQSRERRVEGLMLKRLTSPYGIGRQRGDWWKWKINPYTIDAVLIYAQRGTGKRASLYTDYTFGLWHEGTLIPVAKAYSGLSDDEIARVDSFV